MFLVKRIHLALAAGITAFCVVGSATAIAQDPVWRQLPGEGSGSLSYLDTASIKPSAENPNWRTATLLAQPLEVGNRPANVSATMQITIDCAQRAMRRDSMQQFSQSYGKGEPSISVSEDYGFEPMQQQLVEVFLLDNICR